MVVPLALGWVVGYWVGGWALSHRNRGSGHVNLCLYSEVITWQTNADLMTSQKHGGHAVLRSLISSLRKREETRSPTHPTESSGILLLP